MIVEWLKKGLFLKSKEPDQHIRLPKTLAIVHAGLALQAKKWTNGETPPGVRKLSTGK